MVDWLYDELVLAADLVSRNNWNGVRANSDDAQALSALLRRGQLHIETEFPDTFRSPASIQRKTFDIATADAEYAGKPTRGGRMDARIIAEFRAHKATMQARASAVRALLVTGEKIQAHDLEQDDPGVREGGIIEVVARRRERDPALRARKIEATTAAGLPIACEVCGFDFGVTFGERGAGYIEVHHVRPLHVSGETATRLSDLALLCANCHRICHRGAWITPSALRQLMLGEQRR